MQNLLKRKSLVTLMLAGTMGLGAVGCKNLNNATKGAGIGAGAGAIIGGVIAKATGHSTAKGAIIGGVVGGGAGAIIGHQMDKQAEEMKQQLPPDVVVDRVGEGIQVTLPSGILFATNSAELAPSSKDALDKLATSLAQYPNTDITLFGYTDSRGADEYNHRLSEQRAESTAMYLANRGVDRTRLKVTGMGESNPVAPNDTPDNLARNRRVELAIVANQQFQQEAAQQPSGQ